MLFCITQNVSILFNQITLIIKWMSIRANVSILSNPLSRIVKSKVFNLKMDEHSSESNNFNYKMDEYSSESFTRIYISSWMSILTINDGQNPLQEYIYILMDE